MKEHTLYFGFGLLQILKARRKRSSEETKFRRGFVRMLLNIQTVNLLFFARRMLEMMQEHKRMNPKKKKKKKHLEEGMTIVQERRRRTR